MKTAAVDDPRVEGNSRLTAATGAVAGSTASHADSGRAHSGTDEPRGPWADLQGGFEPDERTGEIITAYPSARPGPASMKTRTPAAYIASICLTNWTGSARWAARVARMAVDSVG